MAVKTHQAKPGADRARGRTRDRRLTLWAVIVAANILSTAVHYTHNYIEVTHYPQSSFLPVGYDGTRLLIALGWPALTAVGVFGFWLYRRGNYRTAWLCLAVYSLTGISSLAHFIDGSPHIPPFWYSTIFVDALAGMAVLMFVYADVVSRGRILVPQEASLRSGLKR